MPAWMAPTAMLVRMLERPPEASRPGWALKGFGGARRHSVKKPQTRGLGVSIPWCFSGTGSDTKPKFNSLEEERLSPVQLRIMA